MASIRLYGGWVTWAVLALVAGAGTATASEPAADLAAGVRQVNEGDFESALVTLDEVTRDLGQDPARAKEVAQAYLYMGIAYVGLRQEGLARTKFQQALRRDAGLKLSAEEFPANVIRVFEATRKAQAEDASLRREAGKKHGRGGLLLLGLGGAAAVGIGVAAAGGTPANQAPTNVAIQVSPEGVAIVGVSVLTFTATATDPDADPLTYTWDFGDGSNSEGPTVTHTYRTASQFVVTVKAWDPRAAEAQASTRVTADTLAGTWRFSTPGVLGETDLQVTPTFQPSGFFDVVALVDGVPLAPASGGQVFASRQVQWSYSIGDPDHLCGASFAGTVDAQLRTMTGIESVRGIIGCNRPRPQEIVLTLVRQ